MQPCNSHRPRNSLELLPPTTSQILTKRPTANLTPTLRHIPSPRLLNRHLPARLLNRSHQLRLQSRRMDTVRVQALVDEFGAHHEVSEGVVGCEDVCGGERFVLGEPPDVKFVDGEGAADLGFVS